ncbi:MAG: DUF4091 domain-containing protein [Fimbriimonadaceae bacterium]|nr:DUF4091 domain-containing protein [Fimbriimonadaceae bacterium]
MSRVLLLLGLLTASPLLAQSVDVPNGSFEAGAGNAPTGWTLDGGPGAWRTDGVVGRRAVALTGSGRDTFAWRSTAIPWRPNALYRLRYRCRAVDGAGGGTVISGPEFCNWDIGAPPAAWTTYATAFQAPADPTKMGAFLRFGQWHLSGTVAFDGVELSLAQPLYARAGELELGSGERLVGNRYDFLVSPHPEARNSSRALQQHQCSFNTDRWVFGSDSYVIYRHQLGGRRLRQAKLEVGVTWYQSGSLRVEVSRDGAAWIALGTIDELGGGSYELPADLLPAEAIWVRLTGQARQQVGQNSDPGSLQVGRYQFSATVDGPPTELVGATRYVAVRAVDPRLEVTVEDLGTGVPGSGNLARLRVTNRGPAALPATATVTAQAAGGQPRSYRATTRLAVGENRLQVPFDLDGTGAHELALSLGQGIGWQAETGLQVAALFDNRYGELLPGSNPAVGLWWCQSGWKVAQTRGLPTRRGTVLKLATARNEADAAQVVVRPTAALGGLTAVVEDLRGPGGALLPAAAWQVLQVRHVPVTHPTDKTGVAAPWPDPLPPIGPAGLDVVAGQNQPLWLRVKPGKTQAAGVYTGNLRLRAAGWQASVPLEVTVWGFTLPDRMTCQSAFGWSMGNVTRYHGLQDGEQQRQVGEKYLQALAAAHISPYDPTPFDEIQVSWPQLGNWQGGTRVTDDKHSGSTALKLVDESSTGTTAAAYAQRLPVAAGGWRLRCWLKTAQPGQRVLISFQHYDAAGTWMSGRNADLPVTGTGAWQALDYHLTGFPPGAAQATLSLRPCLWADSGSTTGTAWFDDVTLQEAANGKQLLTGGDFEPLPPEAYQPTFDFSRWDAAMTRAMEQYHFNSYRLAIDGMGGGTFHSRVEPSLLGFAEGTPEYQAAFRNYTQGLVAHLREKGWLDEAYVYWFDEPDPKDYEFVMRGFRRLKETVPDLPRMLTEQPEPELHDGPNLWCPLTPSYDPAVAAARRKAGDRFWWYVCTGPKAPYATLFIDHPGTELRVWLWQTWQRGIDGILVWESTYWTSSSAYPDREQPQNPYLDPMGWVSGYDTPAGVKQAWGNGDGRFLYPPLAAADGRPAQPVLEGPVSSQRLEMLRDGLEDYEYLVLLRTLLARRDARIPAAERARLQALLTVPANISSDLTSFTTDPAPIEAHRAAVAAALQQWGR